MSERTFSGTADIYHNRTGQLVRRDNDTADLSELGAEEYLSFSLTVHNGSRNAYLWKQASVRIDNGPPCRWSGGQLSPGAVARFRLSKKHMTPYAVAGTHTVVWCIDGQPVLSKTFTLTQSNHWASRFPIPTPQQIAAYGNSHQRRSPYIAGWLDLPGDTRYSEYRIDFKADHIPAGTYCCLGCWQMDVTALQKQYPTVWTEGESINAYAGFQRIWDGTMVSILSFWDIFCKDSTGRKITIRAKRLYPDNVIGGGRFWGEGTGERGTAPYPWRGGHWYRMHMKSYTLQATGTTCVEQWIQDLQTGQATLLCRYDTCIPNSCFRSSPAIFLENYLPETAGEVRSMEARNAQYLDAATGQWRSFRSVYLTPQSGIPQYEGSYRFGVDNGSIWMITSGVGGDWYNNGQGRHGTSFPLE